jgi:hypothetical protein
MSFHFDLEEVGGRQSVLGSHPLQRLGLPFEGGMDHVIGPSDTLNHRWRCRRRIPPSIP